MTRRQFYGAYEPTLDEFKRHLRITSNDLDAELESKLMAAIVSAENYIGKVIAVSQFKESGKISNPMSMPLKGPVQQVLSLRVDDVEIDYDLDGDEILFDAPEGSSYEVEYISGYEMVPYDIKAAVLLKAAALFSNPVDSVEQLPKASESLLKPYRW